MELSDTSTCLSGLATTQIARAVPDLCRKLSNDLAEATLREYHAQHASAFNPHLLLGAPIQVVSKLSKRQWFKAGLVLLVDATAPTVDADGLEDLPKGVYAKWSGWDNTNRKNLTWRVDDDSDLDDLWRSRLDRHCPSHVRYAYSIAIGMIR